MKTTVSFYGLRHYPVRTIGQWMFYFKKYEHVRGFVLRLFGFNLNVRQSDATDVLIKKFVSR